LWPRSPDVAGPATAYGVFQILTIRAHYPQFWGGYRTIGDIIGIHRQCKSLHRQRAYRCHGQQPDTPASARTFHYILLYWYYAVLRPHSDFNSIQETRGLDHLLSSPFRIDMCLCRDVDLGTEQTISYRTFHSKTVDLPLIH
jgi:hypothetical protein